MREAGSAVLEDAPVRNDTIDSFLHALADRVPTPGGGASAALHAAQAAALVAMVARFTDGPKYAEHAELVNRVRDAADELRDKAVNLAEADVAAFSAVADAYRLPKDDEGKRSAAIEEAVIAAARPPSPLNH